MTEIFRISRSPARLGLLLALFLLAPAPARAAGPILPPQLENVGFDQRLNEQVPLDLTFTDSKGREVQLGDYFHQGRPVILVLVYFQCPKLCNLVLNGMTQGMLEMSLTAGEEYEVVTVSFDPREDWRLAASKRESYLRRYGRPAAEHGWHFLTGEQNSIRQLAQSVGFRYRYDSLRDQFLHASGIMILTPEGKISRYFYDVRYPGRDLRLGLVEASQNKIGSPVDQILLYCFHYDPSLGKYSATVMNFVRLGGVLTLIGIGGMLWFLRRSVRNGLAARWAADGAANEPGESGA
jgi:protein SCO1/2